MAHKKFGGWFLKDKVFFQIKVADSLWYYEKKDGTGERYNHLFTFGWYGRKGEKGKLFTLCILFVSIQLGC